MPPESRYVCEEISPVELPYPGLEVDVPVTFSDEAEEDLPSGSCKKIVEVSPEMKCRMQAHKAFVDCDCKLDPHNREYHSLRTLPYGYAEARQQPLEGRLLRSEPRALEKPLQQAVDRVKTRLEKSLPKRVVCTSSYFVPLRTPQQRRQRMFSRKYASSNYHQRWNKKWE